MVLALALGWGIIAGTLSSFRHLALHSHAFDLGIFVQEIWNTAHGHFFERTINALGSTFGLADHFSLVILFLAPVYRLLPDPRTLLYINALAIAGSALPIYGLAKHRLGAGVLPVAVALAYLVYPAQTFRSLFDFHYFSLALLFVSVGLYALIAKRRLGVYAVCILLTLLVREDAALTVIGIGVALFLTGRRKVGLATALFGTAWFGVVVIAIMPALHKDIGFGGHYIAGRYGYLGDTPTAVLSGLLGDPARLLALPDLPVRTRYLAQLIGPLGFLPVLGPVWLVASIPALASTLLSWEFSDRVIQDQYSVPLWPLFFLAAINGLAFLRSRWPAKGRQIWEPLAVAYVVGAALVGLVTVGPGPWNRETTLADYQPDAHANIGRSLAEQIPANASVIGQTDLLPHLAARRVAYVFPDVLDRMVDYIFLDLKGNTWPLQDARDYQRAVASVQALASYEKWKDQDGFLVYRRRELPLRKPVHVSFANGVTLEGYNSVMLPAGGLELELFWQVDGAPSPDHVLFLHAYDAKGQRLAQWDGPPLGPALGLPDAPRGQILHSVYTLPVPSGALPVSEVRVGLYDWQTLERVAPLDYPDPKGERAVVIDLTVR